MQSLEVLKDEHTVIERVLRLLERAVSGLEEDEKLPKGFRHWSIEFIRGYADHCHHAKEEDLLFPMLESRGIPCQGGPIGCMLEEHEIGRNCLRRMEQAISAPERDNAAYVAAAREYVELLRGHIFKENNILFEMAQNCLSGEDDSLLCEKYRLVQDQQGNGEAERRFRKEVLDWERAFEG